MQKELKSIGIDFKPLAEYEEKELYAILDHNQDIDLNVLAGVCSEILRRNSPYPKKLTKDK